MLNSKIVRDEIQILTKCLIRAKECGQEDLVEAYRKDIEFYHNLIESWKTAGYIWAFSEEERAAM